jgi:hypothetical protein
VDGRAVARLLAGHHVERGLQDELLVGAGVAHRGQVDRELLQQLGQALVDVLADAEQERGARGEQEEQQPRRREHVGRRRGGLAEELLGRRVLRRPHERARAGHVAVQVPAHHLGDPEVRHAHLGQGRADGVGAQEHIVGLEVAVHHAPLVGGVEREQHLAQHPRGDPGRQRAVAIDVLGEVPALFEPGDEVRLVACAVHEAAELHDVRVGELLEDLGLGRQAPQERARGPGLVQHLDRDQRPLGLARVVDLAREVGDPRAADRERVLDPVPAIEQVSPAQQPAPPRLGSAVAAPQVRAGRGVPVERGHAPRAVAGDRHRPSYDGERPGATGVPPARGGPTWAAQSRVSGHRPFRRRGARRCRPASM